MEGNEYGVTFVADYFSLTVNVQGVEINDADDDYEVAVDLAANILKHHYGWDVKGVAYDIDVIEQHTMEDWGDWAEETQ